MHDMHDVPVTVLHRRMHILTWNRAAAALLTAFGALPPHERNCIRLMSSTRASATCRRLAGGRTRVRRRTAPGGGAPLITPSPGGSPSTSGKLSADTSRDRSMATLPGHGTDSRAALRFLLQWSSPADRPEPARTARGGSPRSE